MSLNVLFITRKWPPAIGGMETYCEELVAALREQRGVGAVDTITLPGKKNGDVPGALALILFGIRASISAILKARDNHIIHGGDMAVWPIIWLAGLFAGKAQLILSAHGTDVAFASRNGWKAGLYRCYLRMGAGAMKHAVIIANSHATAVLLKEHGFKHATIITLGTAIPAHEKREKQEASEATYILFVGRLIKRKGCRWFIESVMPKLPDHISLKVAGGVIDTREEDALAHPKVDYLGPVTGDALQKLRREALAVIVPNIDDFPNSFEGFGLTTIEAAAAGALVLASDLDGIADAVIDGETGFLLPAGDAEAWAQKITELAHWMPETRAQFKAHARNRIAEDFSWPRVAEKTLAAYHAQMEAATP